MDVNMRPTGNQNTPQPVMVQHGVYQFQPVTQAQLALLQHPTNGQYQLHLVVPASVHIIHYHTSRKCLRDGYFDIEVAPIPGSPGIRGLKVCLGWDVSLQIQHPQQQVPGKLASMSGRPQAVQQKGRLQSAPQASQATPTRPPSGYMSMPTNQAPMSHGAPRAANSPAAVHGSEQCQYMYRQPPTAPPRPANGGAGQQGIFGGLTSAPTVPGPSSSTPPVPLPSASQTGKQFVGNRPGPLPQQRQYSTSHVTQCTPTPMAPNTRAHANAPVPTSSYPKLSQDRQVTSANYLQPNTTSLQSRQNLPNTVSTSKRPAVDLTRSAGNKRFSPATPTKVIKSSPYHSSTKCKAEMHANASRAFGELSSEQGLTAKIDEPSSFEPSEPFQDISTPQAAFFPNANQQVIEMPSSKSRAPSQTSSTLQRTSGTVEALTPASGKNLQMPADEEMVPLGENDSLFGEGSEIGGNDENDDDFGNNFDPELETTQPSSVHTKQPGDQETQPDQAQAVDQNGQARLGEGALGGSDSGNFTTGNDLSQGFDPTFDANDFDLDSNMEFFDPTALTPEEMMAQFPDFFSPKA